MPPLAFWFGEDQARYVLTARATDADTLIAVRGARTRGPADVVVLSRTPEAWRVARQRLGPLLGLDEVLAVR